MMGPAKAGTSLKQKPMEDVNSKQIMNERDKKEVKVASDTRVYHAAEYLYDEILDVVVNIPRLYKYVIGEEMQRLAMAVMLGIQRAYLDTPNRQYHLRLLIADVSVLQTLIRKAGERRWISIKKHATLAEIIVSIQKQASWWSAPPRPKDNTGVPRESAQPTGDGESNHLK